MLAEDDENIRRRAVDKILEFCSEASATTDMESSTLESSRKDVVWQFKVPKINVEATHFYELTNLDSIKDISQPPAVMDLDDTSIAQMLTKPLVLQHPCHNQAEERHVKLITEAASIVTGYEKRDGMIRQKIQSRLLMSKFDSKQQFVWNQHFTYRTSSYGSTNNHCKMCCTVWLCVKDNFICTLICLQLCWTWLIL